MLIGAAGVDVGAWHAKVDQGYARRGAYLVAFAKSTEDG